MLFNVNQTNQRANHNRTSAQERGALNKQSVKETKKRKKTTRNNVEQTKHPNDVITLRVVILAQVTSDLASRLALRCSFVPLCVEDRIPPCGETLRGGAFKFVFRSA